MENISISLKVIRSNDAPAISIKDENMVRNSQGLGDRHVDKYVSLVFSENLAGPSVGCTWGHRPRDQACCFGWWPDHPWALG